MRLTATPIEGCNTVSYSRETNGLLQDSPFFRLSLMSRAGGRWTGLDVMGAIELRDALDKWIQGRIDDALDEFIE